MTEKMLDKAERRKKNTCYAAHVSLTYLLVIKTVMSKERFLTSKSDIECLSVHFTLAIRFIPDLNKVGEE